MSVVDWHHQHPVPGKQQLLHTSGVGYVDEAFAAVDLDQGRETVQALDEAPLDQLSKTQSGILSPSVRPCCQAVVAHQPDTHLSSHSLPLMVSLSNQSGHALPFDDAQGERIGNQTTGHPSAGSGRAVRYDRAPRSGRILYTLGESHARISREATKGLRVQPEPPVRGSGP